VGWTSVDFSAAFLEGLQREGVRAPFRPTSEVGGRPLITPLEPDELLAIVRLAAKLEIGLIPRGGGSQDAWGYPVADPAVIVDMRRLSGVLMHNPADLTLRVRAGTTLGALNDALRTHGQCVPLEAVHPEVSTIGGLVVGDQVGPCQIAYGAPRDIVLGLSAIDGAGRPFHTGGNVVKNVSGLDIGKLFIGSYGTLGFVTEVACKVRPMPAVVTVYCVRVQDAARALELLQGDVGALPVGSVLSRDSDGWILAFRLEGSPGEVAAARMRLDTAFQGAVVVSDAEEHFAIPTDCSGGVGLRLHVPQSGMPWWEITERFLPGARMVFWPGNGWLHLCWGPPDVLDKAGSQLGEFAKAAEDAGATLLLTHCSEAVCDRAGLDPWGTGGRVPPLAAEIKRAFDPDRRMSPGRFSGRL